VDFYKLIHITHGKVHPYQPLFEGTLGRRRGNVQLTSGDMFSRRRGTCSADVGGHVQQTSGEMFKENENVN